MKNLKKLLFALFLLPLFSIAQSNYRPGAVVNLKGDTIRGFIDYQEWESNPASISFKTTLNEAIQHFTPAEISFFNIAQLEAYRSYNGRISMDITNVNHLSRGRDTSFTVANIFLKIEQDGKNLVLYSYTDNLKERFFVAEKTDNKPVELINRYYYSSDVGSKTVTEETFKGQLIYLSSKYDSNTDALRAKIENTNYDDQSLIKIVNAINHTTVQASHKKSSISFYAGISSGISHITPPANDGINTYKDISYDNSYLPRVSLGINIFTNPEVGKLIFRGEIGLQANAFKTYFYQTYDKDGGPKSYFTVNQFTASFVPQVLYNIYNTDKFKFYLEAGISFNVSKYSDNKHYYATYNYLNYNYVEYATSWWTFPLTAGVTLNKKIGIFVTYTPSSNIADNLYTYHSTQLGVTYTFGGGK
jgi:hypothetical protein